MVILLIGRRLAVSNEDILAVNTTAISLVTVGAGPNDAFTIMRIQSSPSSTVYEHLNMKMFNIKIKSKKYMPGIIVIRYRKQYQTV